MLTRVWALTAVLVVATLAIDRAQTGGLDAEAVALTYHKLSGDPLDLRAAAERSEAARRANSFDRPDTVASELQRLQARLQSANAGQEFTITVDDRISAYDHARGEFSITLFTPGYYVPLEAFGQEYQVVFANADNARAIPMAKDPAREFDGQLNRVGRRVSNEIHFKVIGKGDPAGAVTAPRVVRAQITGVRLLDDNGGVVVTPQLRSGPTAAEASAAAFDAMKTDVAGLRVGGRAKDMEATLTRLFGKVTRGKPFGAKFLGLVGTLDMNSTGCMSIMGQRRSPQPGAVCVLAYFDRDEVIRMVQVERLFPPINGEVFRTTLVQKYGPAVGGNGATITWGPTVPGAVLGNADAHVNALTARYAIDRDLMSLGGNRLANVRISLQLIDAAWASKAAQ